MSWPQLGSALGEHRIPAGYALEIERGANERARKARAQGVQQKLGELVHAFVNEGVDELLAIYGEDLGWSERRRELADLRLRAGTNAHRAEHGANGPQRTSAVAELERLFARAQNGGAA